MEQKKDIMVFKSSHHHKSKYMVRTPLCVYICFMITAIYCDCFLIRKNANYEKEVCLDLLAESRVPEMCFTVGMNN